MLCQNCGKKEVNFRYTQIVNGVKKEMALCEDCARKLGLYNDMDFSMPISMSSFLGDMLGNYEEAFLPSFSSIATSKCNTCGTDYDEFIERGLLGCENCYDVFSNKIDSLLKNIHGSNRHVGRISKFIESNNNLNEFNKAEKELKNNKVLNEDFNNKISGNELKELLGHTPLEVLCGAVLGIAIGIIVPVLRI